MTSPAGLGPKLIRVAKGAAISVMLVGRTLGLGRTQLLPANTRRQLRRVYLKLAGIDWRNFWGPEVFNLFWNGEYSEFSDALASRLTGAKAHKLWQIDMSVRMVWHGAINNVLVIDEKLINGFENQIAHAIRDGQAPSVYVLGQLLAAKQLNNPAALSEDADVNAFAELSRKKDLKISDNLTESIAAIRFSLPEQWITGHESEPREELQEELRLWLYWIKLSKDLDTLRHAQENMVLNESFPPVLIIDEGNSQTSNLPILKHGINLETNNLKPYEPVPNFGLYMLHNSLPWDSQGYSTRSHSIIKSADSGKWTVSGATRFGYPYDRHAETRLVEIPDTSVIDGVKYHRLGRKFGLKSGIANYLTAYSAQAAILVAELKPQIIHSASSSWNGVVANHIARQVNVPSVYEVRGLWEVTARSREPGYEFTSRYRATAALEVAACNGASHVFAITNALKNEMIRRGVAGEKITLLPNCVDVNRFLPRERDTELESELGLTGKTVIGYVGSLLDYEGLNLLMSAGKELSATRDDFHILIVGGGAATETLIKQVADLGIESVVTFTGRVPHADVERYYSLIDIAPFPRLALPVCEMVSPLKPFEAMAMEKACVVSSVDALTEIVQDGVTGRVFEKNSVTDFAKVLAELLDNPAQIREYGVASRKWVEENRTWERDAKIVLETYEMLLSKHAK